MDYKDRLISSKVKKAGLRAKIDAKCIECIYDPMDPGSWRKQVEECTSRACPVYSVRPMTSTGGS